MSDLPEVEDIRRINVQPGDVFVVRIADRVIDNEEAVFIGEKLASRLGVSTDRIVVLSRGVNIDVVNLDEHA